MTTSNKVFVSPGVYTSETDLTYVSQSVGVTTVGMVGETLKGPAFEPIFISSYDEFKSYFGGTSTQKDGNDNPKYELPYFSKSYLQESNQLFVTRVLGLTGFKPGYTWGIKTVGGLVVDPETYTDSVINDVELNTSVLTSSLGVYLTGKKSFEGTDMIEYILENFSEFNSSNLDQWFTIGYVPEIEISNLLLDETKLIMSPLTGSTERTTQHNKNWYNNYYTKTGNTYKNISLVFKWTGVDFDVYVYEFNTTLNTKFDNLIVATLRSRGKYVNDVLKMEVSTSNGVSITTSNEFDPMSEFGVSVVGKLGTKNFVCSLDKTSSKYISKVFGNTITSKPQNEYGVYVDEVYSNMLKYAYEKGYIRSLSNTIVVNDEGNNYLLPWDTTISPMVVSEVRGGNVADLFQVQTISDGESANFEIKISIVNINIDSGEFDVLVRSFNDTDENPLVLEKFTRCSMNTDVPGYIGRKIGTSDGEYELRSKYIMLVLNPNHPTDAIPSGFKGFTANKTFGTSTLGNVMYKTEYHTTGDVIGYDVNGDEIISSGDKVRKTYLGLSDQIGLDTDLLKFKGAKSIGSTDGFHLSKNASTISGFQTTPYDLEGEDKGLLENINYRKFTFAVFGGRDGWDIYREVRTNTDQYIFGKKTYTNSNTNNGGVFSPNNANSDYYAYLMGYETFSNPESIDINVFATPGINFYDHSALTSLVIEMIETDRADSLYVIGAPNVSTSDEIVDMLDSVAIDSNYSATYWPWIQIRDTDNGNQIYVPPTGEVLRNVALTDNVSYPWFAVAGFQRGIVKSIKANKKLTSAERDTLYGNRINPIATFSDTGTIIWGNKTLQTKESALDRINVRRLLLRTRKLISAVSIRLLFDQNDTEIRNQFLRLTNPILESIKKERGLQEFKVTVSNDVEDIDANTLRGKIFIKPSRSLEFIDLDFVVTPTGASFDDV